MGIFIPEDKISEIRNTADVVDIVSEVVLLKKAGRNYVGLCPFHSEKTPSFTVSPEKQIFYCFGCGVGGNVFSFLMKQEGISFPEAARMLAKRYGIALPIQKISPEQKRRITEKESLLDINRQAMDYFCNALHKSSAGTKAVSYLKERGITQDVINCFNLGYAPGGWDNLLNFFLKKGISPVFLETSGLVLSRKNKNGYYDRFRDRIIFPIIDVTMQVIGFGGRVLDDSLPKYLNSPETPIYNKGRSLYGLHLAKRKCRESDTVYIVEGYLDLLALYQHGVENVVATLGTALTSEHIRLLKGYSRKMILVYDSDVAGIKAAERCIDIFWKEHVDFRKEYVDTRIIILPAGHDPDSYIFKFGSGAFVDAANTAPGIMSFLIDAAIKKHGLSVEGKIRVISDLKAPLSAINDRMARSLYIKEVSERIGIDEGSIMEKVRDMSDRKQAGQKKPTGVHHIALEGFPKTGALNSESDRGVHETENRLERQILTMMLQFPEILPEIKKRNIIEKFKDNTLKSIGSMILYRRVGNSDGQISDILAFSDDKEKRSLIAHLAIGDDIWDREGCLRLISQYEASRNRRENSLLEKIKVAEQNNDNELLLELLRKKQNQARKRN